MEILLKCPKSKNNELLFKYQKATFLCLYGILYGYSRSYLLCTMDILGTHLFHTIMEPFSKHIDFTDTVQKRVSNGGFCGSVASATEKLKITIGSSA